MWLRVYCWQSGGYWIGMTRYYGHEKKWIADNLKALKQKTGPFLAIAHRVKTMMDVSRLTYVEGVPNDDTVYLISDPQKRKYTKHKKYNFERYNNTHKTRTSAKSVIVDGVFYRTQQEAEKLCGFKKDVLCHALRNGQSVCLGHRIWYANDAINQPTQPKVETDNKEYLYKVEDGYLKVYSKTLCQTFNVSTFNQ